MQKFSWKIIIWWAFINSTSIPKWFHSVVFTWKYRIFYYSTFHKKIVCSLDLFFSVAVTLEDSFIPFAFDLNQSNHWTKKKIQHTQFIKKLVFFPLYDIFIYTQQKWMILIAKFHIRFVHIKCLLGSGLLMFFVDYYPCHQMENEQHVFVV